MLRKLASLGLLVALCLTGPAWAQDSVSSHVPPVPPGPFIGDAFYPWEVPQCHAYVVDLVPFETSWHNTFAIAPIVKASKSNTEYFNCNISAQGISRLHALQVPYALPAYELWENQPGFGVNHPDHNYTPGVIQPSGDSNQFAASFAEYGWSNPPTNSISYGGIVGAMVNYDPADPNRLYVHRIMAATNSRNAEEASSSFGMGMIDEWGNVMFRADGNQGVGDDILTLNNYFNVDIMARDNDILNHINDLGATDAAATTWVLHDSETHNTPNIGPESIFGAPYALGSNFLGQHVYGPGPFPATTGTTTHRPGTTDQRGSVAYITQNIPCVAGEWGMAAMLTKSGEAADTMSVWGVDSTVPGAPDGTLALTMDWTTISDPVTGMVPDPYGDNEFDHYHGATAFRGGNSQIGMNIDQQGRLIAAAVVYSYSAYDEPCCWIAASRVNPSNCTDEWTMVAYSCDDGGMELSGKEIMGCYEHEDVIGRMVGLDEVTGGSPAGPSISPPMVDSAGNIWFISAVALDKEDQQGQPYIDYDSALLRAVYDPAIFGYRLELVLELGSTFAGLNSGLPWQITYMGVAGSSTVDSGTAWSGNVAEHGYLGVEQATDLPTEDPAHLGGMVISVDITYDSNGDNLFEPDGWFNDPTGSGYDDEAPPDESYNVLLYISPYTAAECPGDIVGASPADGTIDARVPHVIDAAVPCYGFGMPDDPATGVDESLQYPIVIDLGVTGGGNAGCWALCETPDMSNSPCGSNSIDGVTDNGDGTYTIALAHGVAAGTVTTIQYNGLSYVSYIHHPANVDANYAGSTVANANDITEMVGCLGSGTCENYEADMDASGSQSAGDITVVVDLLNGAQDFVPWVNTDVPENLGDCP